MSTAYDGLRVLDAGRGIAAATATMYLADQGADVVAVLSPDTGLLDRDPGRLRWDSSKRFCQVDEDTEAGRAELRRLADTADLVVVDDTPEDLARRGLGAAELRPGHPSLVHLWLPMHGTAEPWSGFPSDPLLADALSSASGEHGSYDGGPVAFVTPLVQYGHGALGAAAAAAALWSRNRTGRGRGIVITGLHAAVALQATVLVDAPNLLRPKQSGGGNVPSFRLYQCSDGRWIYLAALTQPLFVTALTVMDLVDVLVLPGVEGDMYNLLKPEIGDPVEERLRARFQERPRAEWIRLLTEAGVPNAPAQTRDEWWDSDVVAAAGMRRTVRHEELGEVELPGDPLRLSRTPGVFRHLPGAGAVVPATELWRTRTVGQPTAQPGPAAQIAPAAEVGPVTRTGPAGPAARAESAVPSAGPAAQAGPATPDATAVRAANLPDAEDAAADGPPLAGLRVLDLGTFMAGPFAATLLSDFGADVVKVEGPEGDPFRFTGISYLVVHRGQRCAVLDLKQPAGRAALAKLAARADVVVDNVRPGVRERFGTDWAALSVVNPRLVRGTVTAWGSGNSLSDTPAFDPLFQARSGLIDAQGGDDAPGTSSMMVQDIGLGLITAFGLLAALYARDRDGTGQEVESSMANASIMMQSGEFVRYAKRPEPVRGGRDWPGDAAAHRLYACRDRWIALAARSTGQLAAVGPALGLPDLTADQLRCGPAHGAAADRIAAALLPLTVAEALDALRAHAVPAAPVLAQGGFRTDPWLAANRMFVPIEDPDFGTCTVLRGYARWSGWEGGAATPAPPSGSDTRQVLAEAGLAEEHITELFGSGAAR
ncbi:CoA transferase [Streptomyces sp. NPDC055092]